MAIDPRKRQKKLEKRKAKQKAERRESAGRDSSSISARLRQAASAPILHCCATEELWSRGMGQVLVSRTLPGGNVAFASFLVDIYCLGVKDTMFDVSLRGRYDRDLYGKIAAKCKLIPLKPECALKLIEGAVQYALDMGLPPQKDYPTAKLIFGDISAEACTEVFTYGKDEKPFFIGGPFDSSFKCQHILRTLHKHCGPGGYHFILSGDIPLPEEVGEVRTVER
jgi:hypothetical protein